MLFKKHTQSEAAAALASSQSAMHLVLATYDLVRSAVAERTLWAPTFLQCVIDASREHLKQFDVSHEIARYIHETR